MSRKCIIWRNHERKQYTWVVECQMGCIYEVKCLMEDPLIAYCPRCGSEVMLGAESKERVRNE